MPAAGAQGNAAAISRFQLQGHCRSRRVAIALDHSDLYIALANRIGSSETIKQAGGMEMKAASAGKNSTAIVVQQDLLRFVRAATEGERFLESTANSDLKDHD